MNLRITTGDASAVPGGLTVEKRFDVSKPLRDLKERLFLLTGIAVADQRLTLFSEHEEKVGPLSDDAASAESQGVVRPDMRVHVGDASGRLGGPQTFDDPAVPKYVMPDDVYDARDGTYRAYKKAQAALAPPVAEKTPADFPHIVVGARCVVEKGHRGEVRFFGVVRGKVRSDLFLAVLLVVGFLGSRRLCLR